MAKKYVRKDDRYGRYTDKQRAAYWKKKYLALLKHNAPLHKSAWYRKRR